jgi:hypothetical protein
MSGLEKVIAQMRQYVHQNDGGHECRANSDTLTRWANTLERLTQQNSQGPTGEASSGESGVQSAADVIADRARYLWSSVASGITTASLWLTIDGLKVQITITGKPEKRERRKRNS